MSASRFTMYSLLTRHSNNRAAWCWTREPLNPSVFFLAKWLLLTISHNDDKLNSTALFWFKYTEELTLATGYSDLSQEPPIELHFYVPIGNTMLLNRLVISEDLKALLSPCCYFQGDILSGVFLKCSERPKGYELGWG